MKYPIETANAFIVRIWLEPSESQAVGPEWRGVVEHVQSGNRRYLKDLGELSNFIEQYLIKMGLKVTTKWKVLEWFQKALSRFKLRN